MGANARRAQRREELTQLRSEGGMFQETPKRLECLERNPVKLWFGVCGQENNKY